MSPRFPFLYIEIIGSIEIINYIPNCNFHLIQNSRRGII